MMIGIVILLDFKNNKMSVYKKNVVEFVLIFRKFGKMVVVYFKSFLEVDSVRVKIYKRWDWMLSKRYSFVIDLIFKGFIFWVVMFWSFF